MHVKCQNFANSLFLNSFVSCGALLFQKNAKFTFGQASPAHIIAKIVALVRGCQHSDWPIFVALFLLNFFQGGVCGFGTRVRPKDRVAKPRSFFGTWTTSPKKHREQHGISAPATRVIDSFPTSTFEEESRSTRAPSHEALHVRWQTEFTAWHHVTLVPSSVSMLSW